MNPIKRSTGGEDRPGAMTDRPMPAPDDLLTPSAIQRRLQTSTLGHRIYYYPEVGSTNDRALELASAGEPEGALVLAERQTQGRGRRQRLWDSPNHLGIYASLVLRPRIPVARAPLLSLMAGVAVAGALSESCRIDARIKWPNDIVIGRRKIAGLLGEVRSPEPDLQEMILGFGINVNHGARDFPDELAGCATSVRLETGSPYDRAIILAEVLSRLERHYFLMLKNGSEELLRAWRSLSVLPPGTPVVIQTGDGRIEGSILDIDDEGALLLEVDGGIRHRVPFAENVEPLWP